ncbi:unnamed protein product, partial [Amoebophrya sp. A25]|eukprot:GSA25T00000364001.1
MMKKPVSSSASAHLPRRSLYSALVFWRCLSRHLQLWFVSPVEVQAWPRSGKTLQQLRLGRRASMMRYRGPGYADDPLWFPLCQEGVGSQHGQEDDTGDPTAGTQCDWYTYGSSQCIFHTRFNDRRPHQSGDEDTKE